MFRRVLRHLQGEHRITCSKLSSFYKVVTLFVSQSIKYIMYKFYRTNLQLLFLKPFIKQLTFFSLNTSVCAEREQLLLVLFAVNLHCQPILICT